MPTTRPRSRRAARSLVPILLAVVLSACGGGAPASPSRPVPEWMEERSGVLRFLRSEGIERCRGLVAAAPGARSREAALSAVAREVRADGSDPEDIARRVGRDLAGPNAGQGPVDAATEGCLLGLGQGLDSLGR